MMQIQTIGGLQLVLYIDKKELRGRGLSASELGLREVLSLTREACREAGVALGRMAEIEAYPEGHGVLIFIRLDREEQEWFCFQDLPRALDALQALGQEPEGALAWNGTRYCISARREQQRLVLSEFGCPLNGREAEGMEENGTLILDAEGLKKLWQKLKSGGGA